MHMYMWYDTRKKVKHGSFFVARKSGEKDFWSSGSAANSKYIVVYSENALVWPIKLDIW